MFTVYLLTLSAGGESPAVFYFSAGAVYPFAPAEKNVDGV
jgi:hypothetical protein